MKQQKSLKMGTIQERIHFLKASVHPSSFSVPGSFLPTPYDYHSRFPTYIFTCRCQQRKTMLVISSIYILHAFVLHICQLNKISILVLI